MDNLTAELDKASQEAKLRDRQMKKTEQKIDGEVQIQEELKKEMDTLQNQKKQQEENNQNLKEAYDLLAKNFKATEERFDHKVIKVDQLEEQCSQNQQMAQRLELDLQSANEILQLRTQSLDELNKELLNYRESKEHDKIALDQALDKNRQLELSLQEAVNSESTARLRDKEAQEKLVGLDHQLKQEQQLKVHLEQDIKKYQDSVAYLSRAIDETKLKELDL